MRIAIIPSFLICCTVFGALPIEPRAELFQNDQVRVMRALEQVHVKAKFHDHKLNRVMIYLQPGRQQFEHQDGRKTDVLNFTAGQVLWSPAEGMHAPEVVGDTPFNIIEVELKKSGEGNPITSSLDPVKIDPKDYKVELENDQVRVLRAKIGAHGKTPMHEHSLNRVTVFLTDQNFQVTTPDGKVETVRHRAGDAVWGTPLSHTEKNLTDKPFEAVVVEIKG